MVYLKREAKALRDCVPQLSIVYKGAIHRVGAIIYAPTKGIP